MFSFWFSRRSGLISTGRCGGDDDSSSGRCRNNRRHRDAASSAAGALKYLFITASSAGLRLTLFALALRAFIGLPCISNVRLGKRSPAIRKRDCGKGLPMQLNDVPLR